MRPGLIGLPWSHASFMFEPAIVDRINAMPYQKRYLSTWCEDAPESWAGVLDIKEWLDTRNELFGWWKITALLEFVQGLDSPARIVWIDDELDDVDLVSGKTWIRLIGLCRRLGRLGECYLAPRPQLDNLGEIFFAARRAQVEVSLAGPMAAVGQIYSHGARVAEDRLGISGTTCAVDSVTCESGDCCRADGQCRSFLLKDHLKISTKCELTWAGV